MNNLRISGILMLCGVCALAACTAEKPAEVAHASQNELVFSGEPEPVKGRLNVYDSMARAAKYNVDVVAHNLRKRTYTQNTTLTPKDMVNNVLNANVNDESRLYGASRVLQFAVLYALTSVADNPAYIDNNFYEQAAEHLSLAVIRLHQDTQFAMKKVREIDRLMRQQQKILVSLNKKLERDGSLSKSDLHYKKNLEVALLKMSEIQKSLTYNLLEYTQLVKSEPKKTELEGRRFYELEDFDKTYSVEIFQEAAVRNRKEFALAKEQVKNYGVEEVRAAVLRQYPLIKRYDINGLTIENDIYNAELQKKAVQIAENLIAAVMKYRSEKPGTAAGEEAKRKVYDELAAAVLTQQEVGYKLVEMADYDYEAAERQIADVKAALRQAERNPRPTVDEKLDILNKKIDLIELDRKLTQISGERAMALRGLYFNAGLSPFSKVLLKMPLSDISSALKKAFTSDVTEMMSAASRRLKARPEPQGNTWAKSDNWLEELIDGKGSERSSAGYTVPASGTRADFAPYPDTGRVYKIMQLGSYEDRKNAEADWEKLKQRFAALRKYSPQLERTHVNGRLYYRLQVTSGEGELRELCNSLRSSRQECLLR